MAAFFRHGILLWSIFYHSVSAGFRDLHPFAAAFSSRQQTLADPGTLQVDLGYSSYQGTVNTTTNVRTWLGIRYARAPVGSLRWQAPEPPLSNRTSVINAYTNPPFCPQTQIAGTTTKSTVSTEDCLFLNVYSPGSAQGLPVFVYIHGGGDGFGGAANTNLNYLLATNNNSFVGVVIQYRLGAFGFLGSDEVDTFGTSNAGLLDQHFALQWVQQYIALFGGDPARVTIAGESAGGGSVMLQALAYGGSLGESLFSNVIASSPWLPQQWKCTGWLPTQAYYAFASKAGCFSGTPYGGSNETIFQCLVRQDSVVLQNAMFNVSQSGRFGTWAFTPCTDGDFIQELPSSQLAQRRVNGRNILVGNNAVEGAAFVTPKLSTIEELVAWVKIQFPLFSDDDVQKVLLYYPNDNQTYSPTIYGWATTGDSVPTANNVSSFAIGQKQRAINIWGESTIVCPSYWLDQAFASPGHTSYHYQFSVPPAEHTADLYILFSRGKAWQSADMITALRTIWGNFISTSNPSISNTVANGASSNQNLSSPNAASNWPVYDSSHPQMININSTGGSPSVVAGLLVWAPGNATVSLGPGLTNNITLADMYTWEGGRGYRCDFWRSLGKIMPA